MNNINRQSEDKMNALLFNIDDTLYDQTSPFVKAYEDLYKDRYDIPVYDLYVSSRRYSDEVYDQSMRGEITMDEMYIYRIKNAFRDFGIDITDDEALEFQKIYSGYQNHIEMSETMKELLDYCDGKVRLGIITNGPEDHQQDKFNALGMERWIPDSDLFISEAVGIAKPDVGIFRLAEDGMELTPENTWYVGDAYINDITGAAGAGWNSIWINRRKYEQPADGPRPNYMVTTDEELSKLVRKLIG